MSKDKTKKAKPEEQEPNIGIQIATICVAENSSVFIDFQGMDYWTFRGVVDKLYESLHIEAPPFIVTNEPDEERDE